jgi:hypothetical protein
MEMCVACGSQIEDLLRYQKREDIVTDICCLPWRDVVKPLRVECQRDICISEFVVGRKAFETDRKLYFH